WVAVGQFGMAKRRIANLDLWMAFAPVAIGDDDIAGSQPGQDILKRWLGFPAQFVNECPPVRRHDRDFACTRLAVPPAVASRLIDLERVVGVLYGRDHVTSLRKFRHQPLRQRRLAGMLESGDAEHGWPHAADIARIRSAAAMSSGRLALKNGS